MDNDEDGVPDRLDQDDDNDGVPDVFEFKYVGSHKGPWKPGEDKRAALCPRIDRHLECGKEFSFYALSIFRIQLRIHFGYNET